MKTATKYKYNPHAWFFAYVRNLADYDEVYAEMIRAGIVSEYSNGETDSLSDMYKNHNWQYIQMKKSLLNTHFNELDKARKRLIAVLFSYLRFKGYAATMEYVKAVATGASGVDRFNSIPMKKLISLYRIFGEKKSKEADDWVDGILSKITTDEKEAINN